VPIHPVAFGSTYYIQGSRKVPLARLQSQFSNANWINSGDPPVPGNRINALASADSPEQVVRVTVSTRLDQQLEDLLDDLGVNFTNLSNLAAWIQDLHTRISRNPIPATQTIVEQGIRQIIQKMRYYEDPDWRPNVDEITEAARELRVPEGNIPMLIETFGIRQPTAAEIASATEELTGLPSIK
jgi:hypothetical protein